MDTYNPTTLTAAVKRIAEKDTGLLGLIFNRVVTHKTKTISTDIDENLPPVAPLISDVEKGVVLKDSSFETRTITPAFSRVKKDIDYSKAIARIPGQGIDQAQDNTQYLKASALKTGKESILTRLKVMAAQSLFAGEISYSDEKGRTYNVDFQRDSELSTSAVWAADFGMTEHLESCADKIREKTGSNANTLILGTAAWSKFRKNAEVKEKLETRRGSASVIETACSTDGNLRHVGTFGDLDIIVYSEQYTENGTSKPILQADAAILLNIQDVMGVRHFGSLMTKEGLVTTDFLAKEVYEEEQSRTWMIVESRPVVVPHRINATFAITVG